MSDAKFRELHGRHAVPVLLPTQIERGLDVLNGLAQNRDVPPYALRQHRELPRLPIVIREPNKRYDGLSEASKRTRDNVHGAQEMEHRVAIVLHEQGEATVLGHDLGGHFVPALALVV